MSISEKIEELAKAEYELTRTSAVRWEELPDAEQNTWRWNYSQLVALTLGTVSNHLHRRATMASVLHADKEYVHALREAADHIYDVVS